MLFIVQQAFVGTGLKTNVYAIKTWNSLVKSGMTRELQAIYNDNNMSVGAASRTNLYI
jgi:hypothetical protein